MELSWPIKLRIIASAAVGVLIIGFFARPLARMEPLGALSVAAGTLSGAGAVALLCLAFVTGLLAYFASWPYGPQIGVLAVPCGLAIWAGRSGTMAALIQAKAPLIGQEQEEIAATFSQRQALLGVLTWESLFWLVVMAAGCAGVLAGRKILSQPSQRQPKKDTGSKLTLCLYSALAVALSALIAQFTIRVLAQDVEVDSFVAQPATAQIAFAVLAAFALAGFVVKTFLDASYTWPAIAFSSRTLCSQYYPFRWWFLARWVRSPATGLQCGVITGENTNEDVIRAEYGKFDSSFSRPQL
jgi:hypothetical protein